MKNFVWFFTAVFSMDLYAADFYTCSKDIRVESEIIDDNSRSTLSFDVERAERVIEVVYSVPGSLAPCEVRYTKEAIPEVLWSAQNQAGYCEDQAKEFVDKQVEWGWSCSWTDK